MAKYPLRIPPVSLDAATEEQKQLLGEWANMNFAAVIAQHPELYKVLLPIIGKLIVGSELPPRERQILCLRTLANCDDEYELEHHVLISRSAGLSDEDIEAARTGTGGLSVFEKSLIAAVDELQKDQRISDQTWQALSERYSQVQMMEVVALVGVYSLMAMLTQSYGIQLEDPETFAGFAQRRDYT